MSTTTRITAVAVVTCLLALAPARAPAQIDQIGGTALAVTIGAVLAGVAFYGATHKDYLTGCVFDEAGSPFITDPETKRKLRLVGRPVIVGHRLDLAGRFQWGRSEAVRFKVSKISYDDGDCTT